VATTATSLSAIDASLVPPDEEEDSLPTTTDMRQPDPPMTHTNGHVANGDSTVTNGATTNGVTTNGAAAGSSRRVARGGSVKAVMLPGTTLYEDSPIDREEFVRLVIQSLRDVGYM
jgi:WD repeat-containing protein 26